MAETISIPQRQAARRVALQALYQSDVQGRGFLDVSVQEFAAESSEDPNVRDIAVYMAREAGGYAPTADAWLDRLTPQWPVSRMATVDRNILRLSVWELAHRDTPPRVVVDEAIEMAKEFSTADSPAFINGILDVVLKEARQLRADPAGI